MDYTKKIKIGDKIYTAKTDFKTALKCNEIAEDETIGDFERVLGILYTLFGEDGINIPEHYEKLLKWAKNYLSCGNEEPAKGEADMSWQQDMPLIEASFMYDYKIDLTKENMSWEKFYSLVNGLSNSEFGNCCVLNRVRNLRNFDISTIKDAKERQKILEAKKMVALKKHKKQITEQQINSAKRFYEALGYRKE